MEVSQIIDLTSHCLHLCNSSNMEEIVFSCLANADTFVTNDIESWKKKFDANGIKCRIKKPDETKPREAIVVDGSSLEKDFEKWEKRWEKQNRAVCIYNLDKLHPSMLKQLVDFHDKMILSVNKVRLLSDKMLDKEISNLDPEVVENIVKRELKNIVLSLLLSKPMCGTELTKILYEKFKVLISPGMLYPTLKELDKSGLLKYEYKLKNKVYRVQQKEQAEILLKNHIKVSSVLSQFLEVA